MRTINTSLGLHTPSCLFRSLLPVPMLVCSAQARVSDESTEGSKSTYPIEPIPNPARVAAYRIELPSLIDGATRMNPPSEKTT